MEAPHISTELTTLPPADRAAIVLDSSKAEAQLRELVGKTAAITTVIDPAGREEAHRAGMTLKNARIAIEKTGKTAREDATAFSQAVIAEEKRLKAITEAEEKRVFGLRDAYDAKVAAEKAEADRRERERVAAIKARIDQIRQLPVAMAGEPAAEIAVELQALRQFQPSAAFAEFAEEARQAAGAAVVVLNDLLAKAIAREAEAARIAAERAELERQRAIAAEEERRLKAEREAFEAERRAFAEQQEAARRAEEARKADVQTIIPAEAFDDGPIYLTASERAELQQAGNQSAAIMLAAISATPLVEAEHCPEQTVTMDMSTGMITTEPNDAAAVQHLRDIVQELINTRTADEIRYLVEEELASVGLSAWVAA